MTASSDVYKYPRYYAIGYQWNTKAECDFIEAMLKAHGLGGKKRLLDIGCGAGRHLMELARRGHAATGIDVHTEMVDYVNAEAREEGLNVTAAQDDLRRLTVSGTYDAAYCFMDTFRFLLTNEDIMSHLRAVADRLALGGLYLTDFWIASKWDQIGNEIHQWEQTQDDTTVRVFYVQHPETIDPIAQTFDDELVFEVHEAGGTKEIRGGRTRTRLIMPQEFKALVEGSGAFDVLGTYGEFDPDKPLDATSLSWRMISVLQKR
jgi:cyclopropane fatty-acyl-phospholipid synthase-like methyltransferase